MKLFSDTGETHMKESEGIAISATPEVLRAIAKFLAEAADDLEEMGEEFSHVHFMDEWQGWTDDVPDIQVWNDKI